MIKFGHIIKSRFVQLVRSFDCLEGNEKGIALFFTFIMLIAVTSSVVAYIFLVQGNTRNTGNHVNNDQAFHLAEAGLHRAIWYLINGNTAPDSSTDGSWRTTDYDTAPGSGANDSKEVYFANGTYTMWVQDSGGNIQISAKGKMNGVERFIRQSFTAVSWTEIINDAFEAGFGSWPASGCVTDCSRYTGGTYAHEGSAAINLQDDTSASVVSTVDLALLAYSSVKVDFWYRTQGFNTGHDFWLQISTNGGTDYTTVEDWIEGTDFSNGAFYQASKTITGYTLTDTTRIRFRADASNNGDDVYLDEIIVSATADPAGSLIVVADSWVEL